MSSQLFRVNIDAISTSDTHYMEMVLQDEWAIQYDTHTLTRTQVKQNEWIECVTLFLFGSSRTLQ